jgi:hypothetical protein
MQNPFTKKNFFYRTTAYLKLNDKDKGIECNAEHLKSEIIDTKTTMESKVEHGTL